MFLNKQNEARQRIQEALFEEAQSKQPSSSSFRRVRDTEEATPNAKRPYADLLDVSTAEFAHKAEQKQRKKRRGRSLAAAGYFEPLAGEDGPGSEDKSGWACFDEDCHHRAYARRIQRFEWSKKRRGLPKTSVEYAAMKMNREEGKEDKERMQQELMETVARRGEFSRKRPDRTGIFDAGVNERNRKFNEKVARAYARAEGDEAEDIRQSLERGTAF